MKPVEAINTMIKLTRSPSASPPRPSPGCAHSPRSVERWALDFQEATYFLLCKCLRVSSEYKMMRNALLQGGLKFLFVRSSEDDPWMASIIASSSSPSISTLSMAATGMLEVLAAPVAFLYRLKKFLICRGTQWRWKMPTLSKMQVVCFHISTFQSTQLYIW